MVFATSSRSRGAALALVLTLACTPEPEPPADGGTGESSTGSTTGLTGVESTEGPQESGSGDTTSGAGLETETSDVDDATAGFTCDLETHTCLPTPPEGWVGPGTLARSDVVDTAHCGGAYPQVSLSAYTQFDAGEAECECTCGEASGGSCEGTGSVQSFPIEDYPSAYNMNIQGCNVAQGGPVQLPGNGTGVSFPVSNPGRVLTDANVSPTGGACSPTVTPHIEKPTFDRRIDACSLTEAPGTCDGDDVCVPKVVAPFQGRCIWQAGDHECPGETPYTERTLAYLSHEDERVCGGCGCTSPAGSCAPKVNLWRVGADVDLPADGTCSQLTNSYVNARLVVGDPQWDGCTPTGGQVSGAAAPTEPVTFCCG